MASQLFMVHEHAAATAAPQSPEGIRLTTFAPGDEADWAKLVATGQLGDDWTVEKVRQELTEKNAFDPAGCFIARDSSSDEPLATACTLEQTVYDRPWPGLHMVSTAPEAQGRGLGKLVTLAVLHYWGVKKAPHVVLRTDDWRLPAIAVYFKLGWRALADGEGDEDVTERWNNVWEKLNAPNEWRLFAKPLIL